MIIIHFIIVCSSGQLNDESIYSQSLTYCSISKGIRQNAGRNGGGEICGEAGNQFLLTLQLADMPTPPCFFKTTLRILYLARVKFPLLVSPILAGSNF